MPLKQKWSWADLAVLAASSLLIYAFIGVASRWTGNFQPVVHIDLSPFALPEYAFFSFVRAFIGYLLSFVFTIVYGYIAAKLQRSEVVLIPFLDILQSIPVFGFLPGLVLGLIALFPHSNIGIELACIIMIATGQAWNMTFSFYYSLKRIPQELQEAGTMMRLNWWQKLLKIELPFSAIGLAWNSLMSMAGGWFFLTVCESFTLDDHRFHVPGIGSYMAIAIEQGDRVAMISGVIAMFTVILFVDFIIWRPVLSWVQKFQMDEVQTQDVQDMPFVTYLLRESQIVNMVNAMFAKFRRRIQIEKPKQHVEVTEMSAINANEPLNLHGYFFNLKRYLERHSERITDIISKSVAPLTILFVLWAGTRVWELIRTLDLAAWEQIWRGVGFTGVRVFGAVLLSTLWAVPFGTIVGLSPRLTRIFQPIVQLAASFPAPMLFPLILTVMFSIGIGLRWGSMLLMFFGVQWYVLFNVLAGATTISRELTDSLSLMRVKKWTYWKKLYLPSIFPALANGWVTAAGGAWNASIVAEYIQYNGDTITAPGIGSMIWRATSAADFPRLAGCLLAMVVTVVLLNRVLWTRISNYAEERFR